LRASEGLGRYVLRFGEGRDRKYSMSFHLTDSAALSILGAASATDPGTDRGLLAEEVAALFDQFRGPLLRYLSSFGLALPDSEEVLQEVFLSLFQHLHRGKARDNIRGWLFRVAHNLALRRRIVIRRDSETWAVAGAEHIALDPYPSPEDQLASNQIQQRLLASVEALPEQDRRCLFLRSEGLNYREIAEILDMSLGGVSLSLARSLARLARCVKRCGL
jgi:RNA polymerase sigma-70 factor (ECF subfamily)